MVVETETIVLCIEVKWTERGLGKCHCGPVARSTSTCTAAVLGRSAYWTTAARSLGIAREPGQPCQLGLGYQAVRLLAATRALASPQRRPVAILLYDGRNPYFAGNDDWEGWAPALTMVTEDSPVEFVAIRWQDLVEALPRDRALKTWLTDKHKLARTH